MQVFWPWSSLRMSACTVPRTVASTRARMPAASSAVGGRPCSAAKASSCWSMAVLRNIGQDRRGRPVDRHRHRRGRARSGRTRRTGPSCPPAWRSTPRRCRPCRRCPGARPGHGRTGSPSRTRWTAGSPGCPSDSSLNRRLVRNGSPSPANIRAGSSPSRLNGNTPAVNGKWPGQVLLAQEAQQLAVVGEARQRHPRDRASRTAIPGSARCAAPGRRTRTTCSGPRVGRSTSVARPARPRSAARPVPDVGVEPRSRSRRPRSVRQSIVRSTRAQPGRRRAFAPGAPPATCRAVCRVVPADGPGDLGQVAGPGGRDDRRRVGRRSGRRPAGSTPSASGSPRAASSPARCWYRAVTPLSLNVRRAGAEHRHVLRPGAERRPVADQLAGHVAQRVGGAAPLELVDRHHVGEVEHVDLLQLRRRRRTPGSSRTGTRRPAVPRPRRPARCPGVSRITRS